jgi:anti-sigma factor RsiW
MTTRISPRDWEALSAYLDDQLNPKDRSRLEARLSSESDLSEGLDELRKTRLILRSAYKVRAPRNFTLSPSMAGTRRGVPAQPGAYSVLRLASLLATVFFVLVTVGSLAVNYVQPDQSVLMSSNLENSRQAPELGMGGGGGGAPEPPAMAPMPTQAELPAQAEMEASTAEPGVLQVTPLAAVVLTPTAEAFQAFVVPLESEVADEIPIVEEPVAKANITQPQSPEEPQSEQSGNSPAILRILQVLLGLLALITGILAFYLRRNSYL